MEIRDLRPDDLSAFLPFYNAAFPERADLVSRFNHEFHNPFLRGAHVPLGLLAFDKGSLIGQLLIEASEYMCNGETNPCYVGYDFYVSEQHRPAGAGGVLAFEVIRRFRPFFGVGPIGAVKDMWLVLGMKIIGELWKYLWFRKSAMTVVSGIRGIAQRAPALWQERAFPQIFRTPEGDFHENTIPETRNQAQTDSGLLSFTRKEEFIRWRFLDHPNRYSLFTLDRMPSTFFVVRMVLWRGLRLLSLVDYRYPYDRPDLLNRIVDSAKRLAKAVWADGVITMSSHAQVDQVLRRSRFLKIGNPTAIVADIPSVLDPDRIVARKAVLATMTEADVDLLFPGVA